MNICKKSVKQSNGPKSQSSGWNEQSLMGSIWVHAIFTYAHGTQSVSVDEVWGKKISQLFCAV